MEDRVREDFPIDWEDDQYVSRREFLKFMTLASGGLAVGSAAMAIYSKLPRDNRAFDPAFVCRTTDVGAAASFAFTYPRPTDLCILVRKAGGELAAFSRRCTHLSCPVMWQGDKDRLYCPCHNGAFSPNDGRVLQGPPQHPLPRITLELRGDEVWAVGIEKGENL